MGVSLNDVRLVTMQFSFSNSKVIPFLVKVFKDEGRETPKEQVERKSRHTGAMVISPTEKCSLAKFIVELETAGYELVDAFCKECINEENLHGKKMHYKVRFTFARRDFVQSSEAFKKVRDVIRAELGGICRDASWRVRSFSNPFYKDGKEIPGQLALSISLEVRDPLFQPDGQPVMVWQRGEKNERIGDSKVPLRAIHELRVMDNSVQLASS